MAKPKSTQEIIDCQIKSLLTEVFSKKPKASEKGEICCARCDRPGVSDSHTISKCLFKKIEKNDHVSTVGFAKNGKRECISESTKNASTLPLFCSGEGSCENFFAKQTETTTFNLDSKEFLVACLVNCERLIHKAYYKHSRVCEKLMSKWTDSKKSLGNFFEKHLGLGDDVRDELFKRIEQGLDGVIAHSKKILESNMTEKCLLAWAKRIIDGDEEELSIFVWSASRIPWRVGELALMDMKEGGMGWTFMFSSKVLIDGIEQDALVYIPAVFKEIPGTKSDLNDLNVLKAHMDKLSQSNLFGDFCGEVVKALVALSMCREELWFSGDDYDLFEPQVGKTTKIRDEGCSTLETLAFKIFHSPEDKEIKKCLGYLDLEDFCGEMLVNFKGRMSLRSAGIGWHVHDFP